MSRILSKLRRAADNDLVQDIAALWVMALFVTAMISLSAAASLWRLGQ